MDYGPYFVVGIVVFGSLLAAFIGFVLHCEMRARKRPNALDEYYKTIDREAYSKVGF